jgi:colicin import membrane protein
MIEIGKIHSAASKWMIVLSVAVHGLALCALVVCSVFMVAEKPKREKVVKMKFDVTEPKPGLPTVEKFAKPAAPVEKPMPVPEIAAVEPSPAPSQAKTDTIVAKPAPKPESIKITRNRKPPKQIEHVMEPKPKPKPTAKKEENPGESFEKKMADLRRKEDERKKSAQAAKQEEPTRGMMGKGDQEAQNAWFQTIRNSIGRHWAIVGEKPENVLTKIGLEIADDGNLLNANIEKSSGDESFDKSALRAVFQAAPFPPLPPGLRDRIKQAGGMALKFTPGGMQ